MQLVVPPSRVAAGAADGRDRSQHRCESEMGVAVVPTQPAGIDATPVRIHQHGNGAKGAQAVGRSRSGLTSKIAALVDGPGNLVRFVLLPGQRHDSVAAAAPLDGLAIAALIRDKAFNNYWLRAALDERSAVAMVPPISGRKRAIMCDFVLYGPKEFRRMATRHGMIAVSFAAMIHLAGSVLALK